MDAASAMTVTVSALDLHRYHMLEAAQARHNPCLPGRKLTQMDVIDSITRRPPAYLADHITRSWWTDLPVGELVPLDENPDI